jgi:hypothetical protein
MALISQEIGNTAAQNGSARLIGPAIGRFIHWLRGSHGEFLRFLAESAEFMHFSATAGAVVPKAHVPQGCTLSANP